MLTIVLGGLRILGIALLVLLAAALLLILLVLFFPVTYSVRGGREPDGTDGDGTVRWNTELRARFRWLFGFVHGGYDYPEPGKLTVKVLWINIFSPGGGKSPKRVEMPKHAEEKAPERPSKKGIAGIFDKIRYTISDICDKIKSIYTKEEYYRQILMDDETKELLQHGLLRLGRLLRAIRPRHVRARLRFGTGSPDTTGYALAVYGMVCPRIGWAVELTPDFESKVLEGRAKLSGHFTLAAVLWQVLQLALDQRLHRLVRKLKKQTAKNSRKGQRNGSEQRQ